VLASTQIKHTSHARSPAAPPNTKTIIQSIPAYSEDTIASVSGTQPEYVIASTSNTGNQVHRGLVSSRRWRMTRGRPDVVTTINATTTVTQTGVARATKISASYEFAIRGITYPTPGPTRHR